MNVPGPLGVIICARNEERSLGACLDAWEAARVRFSDRGDASTVPIVVVLDDCTDRTANIAADQGATVVVSSGGKPTAQVTGLRALVESRRSPFSTLAADAFVICSDADILVEPGTLADLCVAMASPEVRVAFPRKRPLPPRRRSWLARAVHTYNKSAGFASRRTWFSGQLFAIRAADLGYPSSGEMAKRAAAHPRDNFLRLDEPLLSDDVYLSQAIVAAYGPGALREVAGAFWFRAPETLGGMYRKYRRMRANLERSEHLFPELMAVRRTYGHRRYDLLSSASRAELAEFALFQAAVFLCRVGYRFQRAYYRRLSRQRCPPWPAIADTKLNAGDAGASFTSSSGTPSMLAGHSSSGVTTRGSASGWPGS